MNSKCISNDFLLLKAVKDGDLAEIKRQIINGANVNIIDDYEEFTGSGFSALEIAIERGQAESVKLLLEAGADPNYFTVASGSPPLIDAAAECSIEIAKLLIKAGAEINCEDGSALAIAARQGCFEIVKMLVEANADLNIYTETYSPLLSAIIQGHQKVFEYLVPLFDLQQRKKIQEAALFGIIDERKFEGFQILSQVGVNFNVQDYRGRTPLMVAIELRELLHAQVFISLEANLNIRDNEGKTALMLAVESGYMTSVKLLINAGIDINIKDNQGKTALDYSRLVKDKVIEKIILEAQKIR